MCTAPSSWHIRSPQRTQSLALHHHHYHRTATTGRFIHIPLIRTSGLCLYPFSHSSAAFDIPIAELATPAAALHDDTQVVPSLLEVAFGPAPRLTIQSQSLPSCLITFSIYLAWFYLTPSPQNPWKSTHRFRTTDLQTPHPPVLLPGCSPNGPSAVLVVPPGCPGSAACWLPPRATPTSRHACRNRNVIGKKAAQSTADRWPPACGPGRGPEGGSSHKVRRAVCVCGTRSHTPAYKKLTWLASSTAHLTGLSSRRR